MQLSHQQTLDLQAQIPALFDQYKVQVPWLNAVGIGKKTIQGVPTSEDSIVFFVGQKLALSQLTPDQVLPTSLSLQVDDRAIAIDTDVVEMPPLSLLQMCNDKLERPAKGGNCVSPLGSGWHGTLGGVVTNPSGGKRHIISNAHVMAGINQFGPGHLILQNHNGSAIARLTKATTFTTTAVMASDSAIAAVDNNSDVDPFIQGIGVPTGTSRPVLGMNVQKSGARTCRQAAQVRYVGLTITLDNAYRIRDVFLTDIMGTNGDSGSVILDMNRQVVGLLFGGNNQYTAGNDIANVIADLGIAGWRWS
jgi:hypothetical protein